MANQQKYFCEVVMKHNKEILRETISTEAEDMNKGRNSTEMTLQFLFPYVYVYEFVCACVRTYVRTMISFNCAKSIESSLDSILKFLCPEKIPLSGDLELRFCFLGCLRVL